MPPESAQAPTPAKITTLTSLLVLWDWKHVEIVVQKEFSAGSTLVLAAHPEHEFKKQTHTTNRCVLGFCLCPVFGLFEHFVLGASLPLV